MTPTRDNTILGLGCDMLRIERIARLGRRSGHLVLDLMLAPAERRALAGYGDSAADWPGCAPRIAALVSAKEAFFKALGTGLVQPLRWVDVAMTRTRSTFDLQGAAAAAFAALGGVVCHLTICSDTIFVLSTVIILGRPIRGQTPSTGDQ
jgi:phosphopantetheine--protein transferase-like protein